MGSRAPFVRIVYNLPPELPFVNRKYILLLCGVIPSGTRGTSERKSLYSEKAARSFRQCSEVLRLASLAQDDKRGGSGPDDNRFDQGQGPETGRFFPVSEKKDPVSGEDNDKYNDKYKYNDNDIFLSSGGGPGSPGEREKRKPPRWIFLRKNRKKPLAIGVGLCYIITANGPSCFLEEESQQTIRR